MSTAPLLDLGILSAFRVWGSLPCSRGGNGQAFKALQGSVLVSCTRSSQEENDPHTGETGQATCRLRYQAALRVIQKLALPVLWAWRFPDLRSATLE
jgi:hypothetical protein